MTIKRLLLNAAIVITSLACTSVSFANESAEQSHVEANKAKDVYVHMPALVTNLYENGHRQAVLSLRVALLLKDTAKMDEVEKQKLRLQDALLRRLSDLSRLYLRADRPIDLPLLTEFFQYETDTTLGFSDVHVIISDVSLQSR